MSEQIKYFSDNVLSSLRGNISENLSRYRHDGFGDMVNEIGWDIPLGIEFDSNKLDNLDLSKPNNISSIDRINSIIVGEALIGLDPSTANEERIWVRLSHIEAFNYSKARWLGNYDDAKLTKLIKDHMFAAKQTAIRDDHALSRLWWNYEIARKCAPDNIKGALSLILKSADIRSNFVERIWMTSRRCLASAVLNEMRDEEWLTSNEANFRKFMSNLNRLGGGVVFEAMCSDEIDDFVKRCVSIAKKG